MTILIKNLDLIDNNFEKIKNNDFNIIKVFNINFNNKNQIKEDLTKILDELKSLSDLKNNYLKNNLNLYSALIIHIDKFENSTSGLINQLKSNFDLIIGKGGLNKINKFFIEQTNIDFLLDPQNSIDKVKFDFIHHFNSGVNHILCREMEKKGIGFMFSLNNITNKYFVKEMGRINQNLSFSRKFNIKSSLNFIIDNENQIKTKNQLDSIYSLFDISNDQKVEFKNILTNKILKNCEKKSQNYILDGINLKN